MDLNDYVINFLKLLLFLIPLTAFANNGRVRDYGIKIGIFKPGKFNAITDVEGVLVGHVTIHEGDSVHTGVTAILPHSENIFQNKIPAAMYIGNGFGKLTGFSQVEELGNIETPIILTNTLSVPVASQALIEYSLELPGNEKVKSVNPIVGETNDGTLNDIRGMHVNKNHIFEAISHAKSGFIEEGNVGAGTGTICFSFKGGIGTSSRLLPEKFGSYTVGVLVQTNFGGQLHINGISIDEIIHPGAEQKSVDGSCMIVVATDAPITSRNLKRLAKRAIFGLARTGGVGSNGSGDYVIAFSTAPELRISHHSNSSFLENHELRNDKMTPLFTAVIEATEEAILNSLFKAESMKDVPAIPKEKIIQHLRKMGKIK